MPPTFSDQERRLRLVERHHLDRTATAAGDIATAVAALHSTDPGTPYLATWARVPGFRPADLEHALYETRTLRRMHTVRRTLFVVPVDDAPWFEAGGARDIAVKERERLVGWLSADMATDAIEPFLFGIAGEVVEALGEAELSTKELTAMIPELSTEVTVGQGKWSARVPLSTRLLFILAMEGLLVRTRPAGSWRSSQYRWANIEAWEGRTPPRPDVADGRAEVISRYLARHGPVTMVDLRWWTGFTAMAVREALKTIGPTVVELESGEEAYVLPGDLEPGQGEPVSVALLPGLDPTTMGWKERSWYLPHGEHGLFDTNGNAGPTVWVNGRIVGGWAQTPDGQVVYELIESTSPESVGRIDAEATALSAWLDGVVVMPRFPSPLSKRLSAL